MKELMLQLGDLKLGGMREGLEYRLIDGKKSNLTYEDFLRLLVEDELLYRTNKRAVSLRGRAGFKDNVTLEEFIHDPERKVSKMMIKELKTLNFLKVFENIYLTGKTGTGKSYLAQAIGQAACMSGVEVKFVHVNILFEQYKVAERAGQVLSFIKRHSRCGLLILDDLGLRKYTHEEATLLYQIFEERYQKHSTIVTSQVMPIGLKDLFDDQVIADAIVDRLIKNAHEIELKGPTLRDRYGPKKKIGLESKGTVS